MQYKKDELRKILLDEAEKEFLDKGFINASLRQIAKRSGMTIGNLYNYFESKEALFDEIVKDEYDAFIYIMSKHSGVEIPEEAGDMNDIRVWRSVLYHFIDKFMPVFSNKFLILIDSSQGSKYQNTKDEFIEFMRKHFLDHMKGAEQIVSPEAAQLIAVQILSGIIYIIRNYQEVEIKKQLICDLFLFNIAGAIGILNG